MTTLKAGKMAGVVLLLCAATTIAARSQTFTSLANLNGSDGGFPTSLVQGQDGNFYGIATWGGVNQDSGTFFKVTPGGALTILHSFCGQPNCIDGAEPLAGVVLASDGNFYGTAFNGGTHSAGTVFRITATGVLTTLYDFCAQTGCVDGDSPEAGLIQAVDGNFYGTTYVGGSHQEGTVFKITPRGTLTTLHNFCTNAHCTDGNRPLAGLLQGSDGNFYGTTSGGGSNNGGTVFRISSGGILETLYSFTNGGAPQAGLIQGVNGNLYGVTLLGGLRNLDCNDNDESGCGTLFRITRQGVFTSLYNFCSRTKCADGFYPRGLIQGTDGTLYGTTQGGGAFGHYGSVGGTLFSFTSDGVLTTLHSFDVADGANPENVMLQSTGGNFYGTTLDGGPYDCGDTNCGTVFSLSTGLGPFVAFVRDYGKVGQTGGILGQGFTGTTNVLINGVPVSFTVVSDTFLEATIPAGARTGYITVATPSGTLTSNVLFHVIK